jgi:hypothetical protein
MLDVIRNLRRDGAERDDAWRLAQACRQLLTERDESNSRAIASATLERWRGLDADGVNRFFKLPASDFDPDPGEVLRLAENYAISRSPDNLVKLARAAEPPHQELLRRLNRAAGGTAGIVQMRSRLLDRLRHDRSLLAVDADFQHLLSSWFNPGFLRLVQVDWSSPAALLERIIQHEAVHEIDGWSDLRRRLQPDRRCSAGPPRRSALSNSRSRPSTRSPTASPACAAWLSRLDAIRAPRLRAARRASLQAALDGLRARHGVELAALAQAGGCRTRGRPLPPEQRSAPAARQRLGRPVPQGPQAVLRPDGQLHVRSGRDRSESRALHARGGGRVARGPRPDVSAEDTR